MRGDNTSKEAKPLTYRNAMLQEKATDLIDHGRSLADQARSHPVQCLQIKLIVGLHWNAARGRPLNSLRYRVGIPEVVLVATAFTKGRDFAAWLGLVPKQMSTGDRTILGRISKRGNRYLRTMIMQGARVILLRPANWAKHSFGPWLTAAANRLHHNVLATALAKSWRGSPGPC